MKENKPIRKKMGLKKEINKKRKKYLVQDSNKDSLNAKSSLVSYGMPPNIN